MQEENGAPAGGSCERPGLRNVLPGERRVDATPPASATDNLGLVRRTVGACARNLRRVALFTEM
jgi:hypothetical protein